ncbi:MAG: 5'-nucleotidase C-terminal domain-containing protein [Magnetococcus sp. DMHC-6]
MKHKIKLLIIFIVLLFINYKTAFSEEIKITFVHANDVYELQPRNGMGGIASLQTVLQEYRRKDPQLIFTFGGDLLSPSLLSGMAHGKQMIEAMNALHLDLAVPGNHEFDFGPDNMIQQIGTSQAVWLTSNIKTTNGELLPGTKRNLIRKIHGVKVGFFAVTTPTTATSSKPGNGVQFAPALETARQQVADLKAQGAQLIVALTHLLLTEDRQLAAEVKGINLILGGHDHDPSALYEHGVLILKSGSDNQFVSRVELTTNDVQPDKPSRWYFSWSVQPVVGISADPAIQRIVDRWQKMQDDLLGGQLFKVSMPFDSLEGNVRTRENGFANMITDAMRFSVGADIALFNGGGLRGNRTYPADYSFTLKDVLTELPFGNVTVMVELQGRDLLAILENALSQVEHVAGRFPHISGMQVTYDPSKPVGQRVIAIQVNNAPLDLNRTYKVATTDYLASGKDGYDLLQKGKLLIDPSAATLVANHVKDWLLTHQNWTPQMEGRIIRKTQ